MNILIISADCRSIMPFRGKLIKELIQKKNKVYVLAPSINEDYELRKTLKKLGVSFVNYPLNNTSLNIYHDLFSILIITYRIICLNIDLVFSYNIKPVIYSGLVIRLIRLIRKKKPKFYPLITGVGYVFINQSKSFLKKLFFLFIKFLYKESLKEANCVIFQNPDDQNDFKNLMILKKNQKTLRVWGSGIDLEEYKPTKLPDQKVFLMVSRLIIEKGVHEYIKAAAIVKEKYPDSIFRLIGGFPSNKLASIDRNYLDNYIRDGIIEYFGEISISEIKKQLCRCRYFVLPSYREGTPRSVLEALGVGRPIITTDVPGCRETVINDINGKLVKPRDVLDLVKKMEFMLNLSDEMLIKMSKGSIQLAKEKYDVNKVNKNILKVMLQ